MTDARFHTVWIPLQERFYRVAYYLLEDRADALDVVQDLYNQHRSDCSGRPNFAAASLIEILIGCPSC